MSLRNKKASAPPSKDSTSAAMATGTAKSVTPFTLVAIDTLISPATAISVVIAAHIMVNIGIIFFTLIFYHTCRRMSSGIRKKVDKAVWRSV